MIALSTAFKTALIAVELNKKVLYRSIDAECKNSERILENLAEMIDDAGASLKENDCFAVVVGPGSFTGLRVGLATVKGLCAGHEKPIIALSSLGLIAYSYITHSKAKGDFYVVINALSGLFFICKYNDRAEPLESERLIDGKELDSIDGVIVSQEQELPFETIEVDARTLYQYALKEKAKGEFVDWKTVSPIYIRKSQAEDALEKIIKKS